MSILEMLCINRNIVECKVAHAQIHTYADSVLIETLWNVKYCVLWLDSV